MTMTFTKFCGATQFVQKTVIMFHGMLIMERNTKGFRAELYQVDDFYVEILYCKNSNKISRLIGYADTNGIDHYLELINIKEIEGLI